MLNVIEAIEKQLQAQKDEIFFKDIQIKDLTERLEKAEAENVELHGKIGTLIKRVEAEAAVKPNDVQGVAQ